MKVKDLISSITDTAALALQEDYDNSGLQVGDPDQEVSKVLLCLDLSEETMDEAIQKDCDLIISHHPMIFKGIKRVSPQSLEGRLLFKAIRNGISVASMHTNLDNVHGGVNSILGERLGLIDMRILQPMNDNLAKITCFCPLENAGGLRKALFDAGCGKIGNYDSCSFNIDGEGTFRALEAADPYVGNKGELHFEKEVRIEAIFPTWLQTDIIKALLVAHPYEEVAYDIYPLSNKDHWHGAGMIGHLAREMSGAEFLQSLYDKLELSNFRYSGSPDKSINKVAICGGSGSFLINAAESQGADAFITGDIKYHQFLDAKPGLLLCDVGHYESERFVPEQLKALILKKFPTFAVLISDTNTNPVKYFK